MPSPFAGMPSLYGQPQEQSPGGDMELISLLSQMSQPQGGQPMFAGGQQAQQKPPMEMDYEGRNDPVRNTLGTVRSYGISASMLGTGIKAATKKLAPKFAGKVAAKAGAKLASRFIPGIGWLMMAPDIWDAGKGLWDWGVNDLDNPLQYLGESYGLMEPQQQG